MKTNLHKKISLIVSIMISTVVTAPALDVYLASGGSDDNDGLTAETAVATLQAAYNLISADSNAGHVIHVSGIISVPGEVLINRSIHFTLEGDTEILSGFDGGNVSRILHFQNAPGETILKNLTFCNGYTSSEGGAIRISNSGKFTFLNCIIRNNRATKQGGGIAVYSSTVSAPAVTILNSLIAFNESTGSQGGGIFSDDNGAGKKIILSIINSTFYRNTSKSYGGAMFVSGSQPESSFTVINSTVIENTAGDNGGFGPGFNFREASNSSKYIYNCIFEDNQARNGAYGDLACNTSYDDSHFTIRNSYIGLFVGGTYTDKANYNNTIRYSGSKAAGLATPSAGYIASQNSVPLDFDSSGLKKGDAQYLQNLGINTDQLGNVREFKDGKCAAGAVEIPAGLVIENPDPHDYQHFIIYGQSLSVGQESFYPVSTGNVPGNYMIGKQMWINYGNTGLNELNPLVASRQISYPLTCENPLIATVNHLRLRQNQDSPETDNRFIATSCGTGAQPIANLSKGSERRLYENDFLTTIKQAKKITAKTGSTISCPAIYWMQGENDYNSTKLPKDEYKAALIQLKNDMQADIQELYNQMEKPVFFTYQTGGGWTNGNRELLIGMAQLEASNEYDDVICVGPVYQLSYSNNHLCSNGSRWYGEYMAKAYYKTRILGETFKPLQPEALYRDAQDPKKIRIEYHVPQPPLVFDTQILEKQTNYGFSIYLNNAKQTISDVQIAGNAVELTCTNVLNGNVEVLYGEKNTINGTGNLRDSDDFQAFFNYVDGDEKDQNGNFIYPRVEKAGERIESLRPVTREPMDENGNIIYNQPYPLYNFGLAFNYKIPAGVDQFEVPNMNNKPSAIHSIPDENEQKILRTELYDLYGKHILFSNNRIQINELNLPKGIYILKTQLYQDSKTQKIIIK
ncbi:MAG: T9SS type A sorting domain-containing protein [Dysgonamonadaceae bacterium]|jgi:hypothetical protein|nr:T9SS type A sorting domain-containing protein [Dysgonamonadaceae bacterium]